MLEAQFVGNRRGVDPRLQAALSAVVTGVYEYRKHLRHC